MTRMVKIGLFVILTGVGSITYILQTSNNAAGARTYTVHAYVDDASGLVVDSNVKIAGVDVGRLVGIELEEGRARLTMELSQDVQLYEDAEIAKATASMLGTANVSINPGSGRGAMLSNGDVVRNVRRSASISDAVGSANDLAAGAAELVTEINRFLMEEDTITALNDIVETARQTVLSTSELLEQNLVVALSTMESIQAFSARLDASSVDQLRAVQAILDSTASLTARLDTLVGSNDESLSTSIQSIESNLASLQGVLDSLQESAANVQEVTRVVREGEGNLGQLINDDELYTRVVRITEKAEDFVDSTVGLGVNVDFRSEFLVQQLEAKNHFGIRLTPTANDRYYALGVTTTPVPRTRVVRTETVSTGSGGPGTLPQDTTTTETIQTDEFKLNLQLARRWGPLTVRGGVIESTGGVGIDLQPFDQLEVTAEAFDFSAPGGVYLRGYGTLYPFYNPESSNPLQWLYLSGGVDDALGVYERDFFVGAGVRFTDRDLRGLVGFIPLN